MSRPATSPVTRAMPRIVPGPNGCRIWTGATSRGYGVIGVGRRLAKVHRVLYEHYVGPIPEGMTLDHLCHTADLTCEGGDECLHRRCVNPAHLEPVTLAENKRRGRSGPALNATKTHCPKGHPYEVSEGSRRCRPCRQEQHRRANRRYAQKPDVKARRLEAKRQRRARARAEVSA